MTDVLAGDLPVWKAKCVTQHSQSWWEEQSERNRHILTPCKPPQTVRHHCLGYTLQQGPK